ncbi:hypothetical protein SUGI_0575710 [Cryptomeria japonica]|uniref:uncharacterized protein LOC131042948 n=1 Tax=Cryptomeria japonica TaxID=3369 RepID=UPI002408A7D9|nr:uncharacterized protein LOC131042948 [Cryptomeria japonica]XP_057832273.2 uncharacterized protein LOC131042948 [Cryptomeria japonica]GLJ29189.1 hypothetical protein SUGI_0575710 [Cryptomeria japonica]
MHYRPRRNMVPEEHRFIRKHFMASSDKLNDEMGTSMANINQGYGNEYSAKGKKVGSGSTKNMLGGGPSTSWFSGAEDKLIELSSPSVKIRDPLPVGYVSLRQLKCLREAETSKESGSEMTHTPTVFSESQTNKDTGTDEKGVKLNVDMGIGDGNLDKKEVKQTRIQEGVPDKSQDNQSGNSGACKEQIGKSGKNNNDGRSNFKESLHGSVYSRDRKKEYEGNRKAFRVCKQDLVYISKTKLPSEPLLKIHGTSSTNRTEESGESSHAKSVSDIPRASGEMSQQEGEIGNPRAIKREASSRREVYGEHKFNGAIVDQVRKWSVKTSPEASRGISNDLHTYRRSDAPPLRGTSASKGNAERSNQGRESFENSKEVGGPGTGRLGFLVMGNNGEGENDLQNVKVQGEVAKELGEKGNFVCNTFYQNQSVKIQDSPSLGYVPLKQLQLSKEYERRKERGSKIYISNQDTCTIFNKSLRDKESSSDKNEQKGNGDTCIGDEALDKNDEIQTGGSRIEHVASNKDEQRETRNLEASKELLGKNSKKFGTFRMNVKASSHDSIEVSRKQEQHVRRKNIEASQQRNQNILPKEASTSAGTISRVIQGRDCFEFTKEIGGNGNGNNGFLGTGTDMKGEDDPSHVENQYFESEDLGEEVVSVSHIFSPNLNGKIQGSLPSRYVALKQLQSSKESETRKDCGLKICIPKQNTHRIYNKLQRNKDYTGIGNTTLDSNQMRQTENLVIEDRSLDKNKETENLRVFKGQRCKSGQIYESVLMDRQTAARGSLHGSVEMCSKELEQHGDKKEVQPLQKGNRDNYRRYLPKGT